MKNKTNYDVIIIGGSYAGLAAGMALGRALKEVLIIDSGKPCNRQTPYSHNFITQDGNTPANISKLARQQVEFYKTVHFINGLVKTGKKLQNEFEVELESGEEFIAKKLIIASGIKDIMPEIEGHKECWGISVLHCPYCHGYEVRNEKTGVLANGNTGFEFAVLLSNWTKDLTLYTNGISTLSTEQKMKLEMHNISIIETKIKKLEHADGHLKNIIFSTGNKAPVSALYSKVPFEQNSSLPKDLGCDFTEEGYIIVDTMQKTSITGVYACGDSASRMRTVANAIATGTTAGMMINKELIEEHF